MQTVSLEVYNFSYDSIRDLIKFLIDKGFSVSYKREEGLITALSDHE